MRSLRTGAFGLKKQGNSDPCYNVDEAWQHRAKWKEPEKTDGQVVCVPLYAGSLERSNPQARWNSVVGVCGVTGVCVRGTGVHFGKMKKFWKWMVVKVLQHCECT